MRGPQRRELEAVNLPHPGRWFVGRAPTLITKGYLSDPEYSRFCDGIYGCPPVALSGRKIQPKFEHTPIFQIYP